MQENPVFAEQDAYLFREGTHGRLYRQLGFLTSCQ